MGQTGTERKRNLLKIKRLIKFLQGHLSRQIATSCLGSLSNFGILFFSASFFTSVVDASEFVALYSYAIILSAYFSYVLLFRNGQANKLTIDPGFLFMTVAMIIAVCIYSPRRWMLGTSIVVLMFIKDIYRIMGVKNYKKDELAIKICMLSISLVTIFLLINFYFSINLMNLTVLVLMFILQLSSIFLFKLDKNCLLLSVKPKNMMNLLFSAAAEASPIVAGYFVNVYTLNLMGAIEYLQYRQSFSIINLSSLVGSISLIVFLSSRYALIKYLPRLSALIFVTLLVSFYFKENLIIIIAATLLIFSISAVMNSYNKINFSRSQYFCLTSIPAVLIIAYILSANHLIPIQLLLVLSVIQIIYIAVSYGIIISKKFVQRLIFSA